MTGRSPSHNVVRLSCLLLVSLAVTPAPAEAGLLDKVKAATPSLASVPLIKAIGDYTNNIREKGTALIKDGLSGTIDAATYTRRADEFFDKEVQLGLKSFADNVQIKVSNPLAGVKDKLGDTRLGRAVAAVKEKMWATTAENSGAGIATPGEQYDAIDPRIALDINEEETEWYQNETDLMDEASLSVAYLNEEIDSLDDAQEGSHQEAQYQDKDSWAAETDVARRAAEGQARDPWSDRADDADEWEERAALDCTGPWGDIDCGDEYQGANGPSEETDVAGLSDETEEGTYQEAMDSLLGNESESYTDEYSASDGGYEEALAQLEAEAAERERLAAEAAERERQARLAAEEAERERLAAEAAERERQARLAAEREREARMAAAAAERQRRANSNRGDDNVAGSIFGAILGGVARGLAESRGIESGTGGYGIGERRGTVGGRSNNCNGMNAEIEQVMARIDRQGGGFCRTAREVKRVFTRAALYYQNNNCPAELAQSREMIAWANQTERATCN